jgi:hypothetical protein
MSKSKIIAFIALSMFAFGMSVTQAGAATMKFRAVVFHTKVETIEVGDVEGHKLALGESTGLASFETGEVAVFTLKWTADYTKGTGISPGYPRLTFEDGSTIDLKALVRTRREEGKGSLFEGELTINQGSGKYAGIQGKGTWTGRRVVALGAGAQMYFDVTLTYTLP